MEEFDEKQKSSFSSSGVRQDRPPVVETRITKSRDGKWIIHKTIITDIKAGGYYQQVRKSA